MGEGRVRLSPFNPTLRYRLNAPLIAESWRRNRFISHVLNVRLVMRL
jgi:hypothetical protein